MRSADSLLNSDWGATVEALGGAAHLVCSARETKAFLRGRAIRDVTVLLRMVLAYCLGEHGLRLTAAWAMASGLADISLRQAITPQPSLADLRFNGHGCNEISVNRQGENGSTRPYLRYFSAYRRRPTTTR